MENDFTKQTAKVWANLDNPIKSYDFSKCWLILVCRPLRWHSATICDVTTVQLSNEAMHTFLQNFTFHETTYLASTFMLRYTLYMLGLRWLWNALSIILDQPDHWYPRQIKKCENNVQSQWRVVHLLHHIFWQSSVQRGRHTKLSIISSLKWIIKIFSKFYCWVSKNCFPLTQSTLLFGENFPL